MFAWPINGRKFMIYSVGLTGNIGAGKSTILRLFQDHGAVIISVLSLLIMIYWPGIKKLSAIPAAIFLML